nr:ribonuclease H-like domain-containing protein [Tanacetum cinerariifolium]
PPEETTKDKGLAGEVSSSRKKKGRTVAIIAEDLQKRKNDVKERTTILLALPDEHQLRFSKYDSVKELWEVILKTFSRNEATKKTKKNQLKQQYGNFKAEGSETLEQIFNRLQVIVSHLEFMDVPIEQDDLNQKFLTSLAPEWLVYIIVWRNKDEIDTMILDDVYNHLKGIPQDNIGDKGYWDNSCSRHMIGNISYLSKYEPFNEGYVSFGHGRGKITGKGSIKTDKLEFENVYFVEELKYNLFSVSQIRDNKNSVLFTDTKCLMLGKDFKLVDDKRVLLRTSRQQNMYTIDLKNVVPHKKLTCLIAKALVDESMLWHRRIGHLNFKTMNKLVRSNLVKIPHRLLVLKQVSLSVVLDLSKVANPLYSLRDKDLFKSKDPQVVVAAAKLPILNPNEFDLWKMRIEQYFLMSDYSLWGVILNGDSPTPTIIVDGVVQVVAPTTAEQRLAKKNELEARGTLLMVLPDKHQLKFNIHKDAKSLIEAIEKRFCGNKKTKKVQKTLLKQQYENFRGQSSESLDQIHDRLQKLISQLEILAEVKSSSPTSHNTQNITFVSSHNTDNTNESVSAVLSISAASTKALVSTLSNVDSLSDALIYSFFASKSNSPQLENEDLKQIDAGYLEEMDLKCAIGFDMSKVECYNFHKRCHFTRECKSLRDNRNKDTPRRTVQVEASTSGALNENVFEGDIKLLKLDVMLRDNALVELTKKFKEAEKERDELKRTLEKYMNSLKNLRTFMPSKPNLVFYDAPPASETVPNVVQVKSSTHKTSKEMSKTHRPDAPIIEDWTFDFKDESEPEFMYTQKEPSFVPTNEYVKTPRHLLRQSLGMFEGKADKGFLVGYSVSRNQPNNSVGIQENINAGKVRKKTENEIEVHVSPSSDKPKKHDEKAKRKAKGKSLGHTQEEGIDYEEVFAPVARIEAIWLFLAYDSFMGFMVYQMDVKSAFIYGTIKEEVFVCQPLGFEDASYPDKVYKVVKALYGLHQAPRTWQIITAVSYTLMLFSLTKDVVHLMLLDDDDGVECLSNEEIFAELACMGYEKLPHKLTFYKEQPTHTLESTMTLLNTLMETYATLTKKVAHLEQDKVAQALEIVKLKHRVKKLENKRRSKSSGLKRRMHTNRGKIAELDADEDVTLVDVDTSVKMDADIQGKMEEDVTTVKEIIVAEPETTMFNDEEEKQEKGDLERDKVLQQQYDQKQENIDWNVVAKKMQEKHHDNIKKYQCLKRKPISIAQARKHIIVYLKNMTGYKMQHFKGMTYDQESFKKLRAEVEVLGSHFTQEETLTVDPQEMSKEDVKNMLQIVPVAEFKVEALQVKEDLDALWRLVKEKFSTAMPTVDREKALWVELKVHQVTSTRRHHIFMLIEKDYPLTDVVMLLMLSAKLQVDEDREMARDLVMKIFMEANKLKSYRNLDTSSN